MSTSPAVAPPATAPAVPPYRKEAPETARRALPSPLTGPRIQPPKAPPSAAIPAAAVAVEERTLSSGPRNRIPAPSGRSVKISGTTNAGRVYFQVRSMVLKGLPPVRAAAAKGDSAVGGLTS